MAAYGVSSDTSAFELDHLVPLQLGGAPADARNLWQEADASRGSDDATAEPRRPVPTPRTASCAIAPGTHLGRVRHRSIRGQRVRRIPVGGRLVPIEDAALGQDERAGARGRQRGPRARGATEEGEDRVEASSANARSSASGVERPMPGTLTRSRGPSADRRGSVASTTNLRPAAVVTERPPTPTTRSVRSRSLRAPANPASRMRTAARRMSKGCRGRRRRLCQGRRPGPVSSCDVAKVDLKTARPRLP